MLYLAIGFAGLLLLGISMLFDDILDIFGFDTPFLSTQAIGAFLAGFGFIGYLVGDDLGKVGTIAVAGFAGAALAAVAGAVTHMFQNARTDATPSESNTVGSVGVVVSDIRAGQLGQVVISVAGHSLKMSARADDAIPAGTPVVVTATLSPTSVHVAFRGF